MGKGRWAGKQFVAALAFAVLAAGVVLSALAWQGRAARHRQELASEFNDAARSYAFAVQRRLDVYEAANLNLAAYVSASETIDQRGFSAFVAAARDFERLPGISSFGYLPQVAARDAAAFERRVAREFPGFRIQPKRPAADFYFPMLYGVHRNQQQLLESLRGTDYGSIPDRLAAIRVAQARNVPAASYVHPSLGEQFRQYAVLVTVTPARTLSPDAGNGAGRGMVFSVITVADLFGSIEHIGKPGLLALEVTDRTDGRGRLVYGADGVRPDAAGTAPYAYTSQLHYADRVWELRVVARPGYLSGRADRYGAMVLGLGLLLSLVAAYATFRGARHYLAARDSAELAQRFESFFEAHPFAAYSMDRERRLVSVNRTLEQELAVDRASLIGAPVEQFISAEKREMAAAHFREALSGHAVAYHNTVVNAHGATAELAIVLIPLMAGGEVRRVLGFAENITERKRFEKELHDSRQMLQLILDMIPQLVFWKGRDCAYLGANRSMLEQAGLERSEQIAGLTDDDMPWRSFAAQYRDEDVQVMESGLARLGMQQAQEREDGSLRWLDVSKIPLKDHGGAVVGMLGVVRDITESKQMEAELVRRANYDSWTGLPNRGFFYSTLQQSIRRAERSGRTLALLYFDIDHFKQINDTYGHDAGDEVIRTFAARVQAVLRKSDFVARLGGDEFVMIVEELAAPADAAGIAGKLVAAMREPIRFGGQAHGVTTSIGIAFLEPGMQADHLVRAADDAMYAAKRAGRNCFRGPAGVGAG